MNSMKFQIKKSILIVLLSLPFFSIAKENEKLKITNYTCSIRCDTTSDYIYEEYKIIGNVKENGAVFSVYFDDLHELANLNVKYVNKKGQFTYLKSKEFYEVVQSDNMYYSGVKNKSFIIPFDKNNNNHFEISYTLYSINTKVFNELKFYSQYNIDTLIYKISTHSKYRLVINNKDLINTKELKIDSIDSNTYIFTKYNIKNIISKLNTSSYAKNYTIFEGIRYYLKEPTSSGDEFFNFSTWYLKLIEENQKINNEHIDSTFNTITKGSNNKDSIIKYTLEYVKNTIRYIAIEDGINAYKPRSNEQVLKNKKGDCKDMANLIVNILRKNNIESYIALISSNNAKYDFDFPCLASANHAIAMAKLNNKWIVLDATDPLIPYPYISRHTQGKTAFIIKDNGYEFYPIPKVKSNLNSVSMNQKINFTDSGIINTFIYKFKGYSISNFIEINDENDTTKRVFNREVALENLTSKINYSNTKMVNQDSVIIISGKSYLNRSLLNISANKVYLSIDFIPIPINLNYKIDSNEVIMFQETSEFNLNSEINIKDKVKLVNPKKFEYKSDTFKFNLNITQVNEHKLILKYHISINDIKIDKTNFNSYQQFSNELKKMKNYVLAIQ